MTSDTLAIILGGGRGSRLFPLTDTRSKPAVPIGGKYRLIDVPISGCLHAEIRRIRPPGRHRHQADGSGLVGVFPQRG